MVFNFVFWLFFFFKRQPPEVLYQKKFPKKFQKIHRSTPLLEYLFNKVVDLRPEALWKRNPEIGVFLKIGVFQNIVSGCFCSVLRFFSSLSFFLAIYFLFLFFQIFLLVLFSCYVIISILPFHSLRRNFLSFNIPLLIYSFRFIHHHNNFLKSINVILRAHTIFSFSAVFNSMLFDFRLNV